MHEHVNAPGVFVQMPFSPHGAVSVEHSSITTHDVVPSPVYPGEQLHPNDLLQNAFVAQVGQAQEYEPGEFVQTPAFPQGFVVAHSSISVHFVLPSPAYPELHPHVYVVLSQVALSAHVPQSQVYEPGVLVQLPMPQGFVVHSSMSVHFVLPSPVYPGLHSHANVVPLHVASGAQSGQPQEYEPGRLVQEPIAHGFVGAHSLMSAHVIPSPVNPVLHLQVGVPDISQVASGAQTTVPHKVAHL